MTAEAGILVCEAGVLHDGGQGVRFALRAHGQPGTGFVVRFQGVVYGYLNRCAHVPVELDWKEGVFFESSGLYLMCSMHGAVYVPESGKCTGGPCRGGRLHPIAVREVDGRIYWLPDGQFQAPAGTE